MTLLFTFLFIVSLISGALALRFKDALKKHIPTLLSFSGAYLLSICFLHLLPELFESGGESIGFYLMGGYFLQLVLDYFSRGIEHGHVHVHRSRVGQFPLLVFISLCLHAFLESLPLLNVTEITLDGFAIGIALHKIPIAFVLVSLLLAYELSKSKIWLTLIIFSIMAPVGAYVGGSISEELRIFQIFVAISIGIILHLSTTILLENNEEHQISLKKLSPILAGAAVALLTLSMH